MGVERHLDSSASASTRLNKSNSVDIYRPPALRRHGESVDNENYFQNKEQHHSDQQLDLLSFQPKDTNCISAKPLPHPLKTTQNYCSNADTPASVTISTSTSTSSQRQVRRERRPDRAVYVPRARRSLTTPPAVSSPQQLNIQPHNQQQTSVTTTPESRAVLTSSETTSALKGSAINITSTTAKTTENCKSPVKEKCSSNSTRRSTKDRTNGNIIRKEKSSSSSSKRLTIDENEKNCFHKNNSINNQNTNDQYLSDVPDERRHMNNEPNCNDKNALLVKDCDISNPKELSNSTNLTNIKSNVIKPASDVQKVVPKMNTSPRDSLIPSVKPENVANLRIEDVLLHEGEKTDKCDRDAEELLRASKEINRSNRRIFKQTFNSDILEIPEKVLSNPEPTTKKTLRSDNRTTSVQSNLECNEASVDEDDWDAMYDESGDCIDPKILQELTAAVGQVKIELPKMDYSAYLTKQSILNDEEFPHVLEVSNFPVEFKNQDLLMVFSQYKESGFDIKWVDDTHALAVFSSSQIAAEVLAMGHPFVVLKPLADATVESRLKAKKCSASLQPYRPRPETCAALARRLVTGALGVRLKTAAQEREIERRVLREAKERKLLAAKQRDEMWES